MRDLRNLAQCHCQEILRAKRRAQDDVPGELQGFTQKYNVDRLVYYEACANIVVAIEREKQIKGWSRKKKEDLSNALNPVWDDLYRSIC